MKGCRPLTDSEIQLVLSALGGRRFSSRDRALVLLGMRTGFRISELLSLTIGDLIQNGSFVEKVHVARCHMKGEREGRSMFLHEEARCAVEVWINELAEKGLKGPETLLFRSRQGTNKAINRDRALKILKRAFASCGLSGKTGTHTLRKTFAKRMKANVGGDLQKLQKLMGHAQITSTMSYIEINEEELKDAVLKA